MAPQSMQRRHDNILWMAGLRPQHLLLNQHFPL